TVPLSAISARQCSNVRESSRKRGCGGGALASRASAASEPSVATSRALAPVTASADDACAHRHGHHLGAVTRAELAGDASQVALHGERGQSEGLADLLVGAAVGDEA